MTSEPAIFVGTSGYSFADWAGPFYPPGTRSADFLPYYARHFSCVEVNSTYYGIPRPEAMARMEQKTPAGFRFIVKLNQAMTHERATEPALYARFRDAIRPLQDAGKFHGLLAQFPWGFQRDERAKRHLEAVRALLPGEPLWVEFRHASWMHPGLPGWLAERSLGYCCVDEPALPGLVPPVTHVTNGAGYVRFHGRNAGQWWGSARPSARAGAPGAARAGAGEPSPAGRPGQLRYDYDYSERELAEWVARVQALAQQAKQTYLFFNNCHAGQAARNAKLMEERLPRTPPPLSAAPGPRPRSPPAPRASRVPRDRGPASPRGGRRRTVRAREVAWIRDPSPTGPSSSARSRSASSGKAPSSCSRPRAARTCS